MLSLLPDWFWTLVLIAGVLGVLCAWVLKFVPFVKNYKLPIQVVSILLLLIGVYFQGVIANEEKYKSEHERLKEEIAKAEAAAVQANQDLSAAVAEKNKAVEAKGQVIVQKVDRWIKGDPVEVVKEVVKEKNLSEEEKKKFEAKITELQNAQKNCPVPELLIEQLNQAAKKPISEGNK